VQRSFVPFARCFRIDRAYSDTREVWRWKRVSCNFKATISWIYYRSAVRAVCMIFGTIVCAACLQ